MLYLASRVVEREVGWASVTDKQTYAARHLTIGHHVLDEDRRAEKFPDSIYQRLDSIIDAVLAASIPIKGETVPEARATLTAIESVVRVANVVCSIPYYLMHSFSDGLHQKSLDRRLIGTSENTLREPHLLAHGDHDFSHVDCDLGTLLYLAIGEVLGIPLCMVEVPNHNFIRWRLNSGEFLNWDTNFGFDKYTNEEYASVYGVADDEEERGVFLADMSTQNTIGYFCFVRGLTFQRQKRLREAIGEYRSAIPKYPQSPSARNNLAWQFVSERIVQSYVSAEEAQLAGEEACALSRSHNNLDTLACVYAEKGDFLKAIVTEEEAYALSPSPDYLKMINAFKARKTWLEVNGT